MLEEMNLSLRIFDIPALTHGLALGGLAAGFTLVWLSSRLRSAAVAALGLGLAALANAWSFVAGWLPSLRHGLADLGSEISTLEWYGLAAGGVLVQLPLLVGTAAAILCLRGLVRRSATRSTPAT